MNQNQNSENTAGAVAPSATCFPLVWTRSKPTASGYYWYQDHVKSRSRIYDVVVGQNCGFAQKHNGETFSLNNFSGWWAGPIPKPLPPPLPENAQSPLGMTICYPSFKKTDTPESDAAWEYAWDEGGCHEGHLLDTMQKLERERDEARKAAEYWRSTACDVAAMPITESLFSWENANCVSAPLTDSD